jgi:hypothetical protein
MMGFDNKKFFNSKYFKNFIMKNLDLDWIRIQEQPGSGSIFVKTDPKLRYPSAIQANYEYCAFGNYSGSWIFRSKHLKLEVAW